jgi:type II secretory pathway component PulJ
MCPNRKFNRQAGFSMMELLISMVTMTIITGAAFALIGGSIRFTSATFHITDAEQTLRTAHEIINRDLTTAGDGLRGIGTIKVPRAFVASYLTQTPDPTDPNYVNLALVTSDDNIPGTTAVPQSNPAANVLGGSDRLTMLTQDTSFPTVSLLAGKITVVGASTNIVVLPAELPRFQVGEIYAITAQNSVAFGVVTGISSGTNTLVMTNGDAYGINQTGAATPINTVSAIVAGVNTQPASIMRLQIIHYYVNSTNLLVRRVFGVKGSAFVDSVIAEHVTNMQFRYLVNLPDPNGFLPQPIRQLSPLQQTAVREVETTIAVETVRAVNAVTANNNGRQTISTTTATTVRNLQFRKAL